MKFNKKASTEISFDPTILVIIGLLFYIAIKVGGQ